MMHTSEVTIDPVCRFQKNKTMLRSIAKRGVLNV